MGKVIAFRAAAERREAARKKESEAPPPPEEPDGLMQFTHTREGSRMVIEGTYSDRLQFGIYTLVKAMNDLVDRVAANGAAGHFSSPSIEEGLPVPRRRLPKRLREATGFGDLQ